MRFLTAGMTTGMSIIIHSKNTQAAPPNLSTGVYVGPDVAAIKSPAAARDIPVYIIALIKFGFLILILRSQFS